MSKKESNKKSLILLIIIITWILIFCISCTQNTSNNNLNSISSNTNISNTIQDDSIVEKVQIEYLANDFFEILCEIANLEKKDAIISDEYLTYTSANNNYEIEIIANTNNIIQSLIMKSFIDDNENFFNASSRLLPISERKEIFNWLHNNINQENSTTIKNLTYTFSFDTNRHQTLMISIK